MPTSKSIYIKDKDTDRQLEMFVVDAGVFIQNDQIDSSYFFMTIAKEDWEELKKFIDEQFATK